MPAWYTQTPTVARPPLSVPAILPPLSMSNRSVAIELPERRADCSGVRPSWFPFQVNVCDVDEPDPRDLTWRERTTDRPPTA